MIRASRHRFAAVLRDRGGNTAITFALGLTALLGAGGAAVDVAAINAARTHMQAAADGGALAGAKEFRLGNAAVGIVAQVATSHATATLGGSSQSAKIVPSVDTTAKSVTVTITADQPTWVLSAVGIARSTISVTATAKVVGGAPICVIGLDAAATKTVFLDKTAHLEAPNCAVYSNSTGSSGLESKADAILHAAFVCSAGGATSTKKGNFSPEPQLDCPGIPDPLASRPQPTAAGCLQTDLVVSGGTATLMPGTYCGGVTLTNGAKVTMSPGVYAIKNGPFVVTGGASLSGANVGLFLTGKGAQIRFDGPSTVSLTAPKSGEMAGILMFEDRSAPIGQTHEIYSNDTRMLLGTIYLSRGRLHIASNTPVADQSAYTIVVANQFSLSEGPTMVLNTNYDATNIPVPAGVGPNSNRAALTN